MEILSKILERTDIGTILAIVVSFWFFYQRLETKIDKVELRLGQRIDKVEEGLNQRIDKVEDKIDKVEEGLNQKIDKKYQHRGPKMSFRLIYINLPTHHISYQLAQLRVLLIYPAQNHHRLGAHPD